MITKMSQLPEMLRQTLTWDQGSEMANHAQIAARSARCAGLSGSTAAGHSRPDQEPGGETQASRALGMTTDPSGQATSHITQHASPENRGKITVSGKR